MNKVVEILPDDLPDWAQDAMDRGQLFTEMLSRIRKAEAVIKNSITNLERSEVPFYTGLKDLKDYQA